MADFTKPMKSQLKNYLSVTKAQWNGLIIFLILIAATLAAPYIYQYYNPPQAANFEDFEKDIALLKQATGNKALAGNVSQQASAQNINATANYTSNKLAPGETIELNTADSAKLTRIRGIGPTFAARISEYRKRLGGFLNKEQLKEVYGIDAEKYTGIAGQVTVNPSRIVKININEVDFEGLRRFPYLSNKQCNAVIQYRLQHGNYSSITDMQNIAILDDIILRKIEPYINFK